MYFPSAKKSHIQAKFKGYKNICVKDNWAIDKKDFYVYIHVAAFGLCDDTKTQPWLAEKREEAKRHAQIWGLLGPFQDTITKDETAYTIRSTKDGYWAHPVFAYEQVGPFSQQVALKKLLQDLDFTDFEPPAPEVLEPVEEEPAGKLAVDNRKQLYTGSPFNINLIDPAKIKELIDICPRDRQKVIKNLIADKLEAAFRGG